MHRSPSTCIPDEAGSLTETQSGFEFEGASLAAGLSQLALAADGGNLLQVSAELSTQQAVWEMLERGEATAIIVDSEFYLQKLSDGTSFTFAALPGRSGAG